MRILYLADSYRPSRSACANRTCVLVQALRDAGHDVQVLASTDSLIGASEDYQPPEYVTFFKTYPLVEKTLVNRLRNNFGGAYEAVKAAKRLGDFDLVVCTTPPLLLTPAAIKIAESKRAMLVVDVRDIWPEVAYQMGSFSEGSIYGRVFRFVADKAYRSAAMIVTVTPTKVEKIKSLIPIGMREKVYLAPNGLDLDFLNLEERPELVEEYRLDDDPPCVYVGNLGLAQGLSTLLEVAKRFPDHRFLLFGDGAEEASLRRLIEEDGLLNVRLCGRVDDRGVFTLLRHARCAYVPLKSSRMTDSVPTKLYEALGCGCPVLLAACGDSVAVLEDCGLGVSAAPEDLDAVGAAFREVVERNWSDEERNRARRVIRERYSRQIVAVAFADEVDQLVSGC